MYKKHLGYKKARWQGHESFLTVNLNNKSLLCFFFFFLSVHFILSLGAVASLRHREYMMAKLNVFFKWFMAPSNCKNKYINHQIPVIDH